MKILVIVDGVWPPAVEMTGMKSVYGLQKKLASLPDLEISILTSVEKWTRPDWEEWFRGQEEKYGIRFFYIDNFLKNFPRVYFYLTRALFFFKALWLIKKEKFDIVHEYSSLPLLVNRTRLLGKLTGIKTVHTICTGSKGFLSSWKLARGKVDKVICTTKKMVDDLEKSSEQSSVYIPLGIDIDVFLESRAKRDYRKELDISTQTPVVLYLGLLDERKGIFTFVEGIPEVLEKHPEAIFIIATSGQEGNFYDYRANKRKVLDMISSYRKNVRFLEGKQNVAALMDAADIFVYPLTTMHGILGVPSTLIEAFACGKAVVVSDLEELREFVKDGENGLLFGNIGELAVGIEKILKTSSLKQKFEENSLVMAQKYDTSNIVRDLKKAYLDPCLCGS